LGGSLSSPPSPGSESRPTSSSIQNKSSEVVKILCRRPGGREAQEGPASSTREGLPALCALLTGQCHLLVELTACEQRGTGAWPRTAFRFSPSPGSLGSLPGPAPNPLSLLFTCGLSSTGRKLGSWIPSSHPPGLRLEDLPKGLARPSSRRVSGAFQAGRSAGG
jgi:hypothetical protein